MSERERQRRLHVTNRLEELRRKHGDEHEWIQMPLWLDTLEGWQQMHAQAAQQAQEPHKEEERDVEPPAPPPPQNRAVERPAEAWQRNDRWV